VNSVRHVHLHARDLYRSALVELDDVLGPLRVQVVYQLDDAGDRCTRLLRDAHRVGDVIEVTMRNEDRVEGAGVLQFVRTRRIVVEERVDQDPLARRGLDAHRRVT
jgi:hypothetical protein